MSVQIVFICHDEESIQTVLPYGYPILLVGNKTVQTTEGVIVVRELPFHIEHLPKLLTFTAWYAIVKNQLFKGYEYLCLLEWDAVLDETFVSNLNAKCASGAPAISFMEATVSELVSDVNPKVFIQFLKEKNIPPRVICSILTWGCSSNQCLRRDVLEAFVRWYYPCLTLFRDDPARISWYHERVYMVFLKHYSIPYVMCKGITHGYKNSHRELNKQE